MARAPVRYLCAIVFLIQFATAAGTIFGTDGAKRFNVAQSLIARGRADIEASDRVPIGVDGRKYAQYAIGNSVAMVPFLLAGKAAALAVPSARPAIAEFAGSMLNLTATVLLVGLLAVFVERLGFSTRTAVAVGLIYAFATFAWQQSKDSFEHPLVALYFTAMLFYLHQFAGSRSRGYLLKGGVALGLAVLTRHTAVLGFAGAGVFLLALTARSTAPIPARIRELITSGTLVFVAALPFVLFNLWFNYVRFGSPFETGHAQLHGSLVVPGTFLGGLFALTLHWETGVFVFNPVLALALWGAARFFGRHRALALGAAALIGVHFLFYALTPPFLRDGGWNWGPRFFCDVMPVMVLFAAPVIDRAWRGATLTRIAIGAVIAVSVVIQIESVLVNANRNFVKKATHVDGYAYDAHGFRDSLLIMQAVSVREIAHNVWNGRTPSLDQPVYAAVDGATLVEQSMTYGTFQLWWVYALYFYPGALTLAVVIAYLAGTLVLLIVSARALRRSVAANSPIADSRDCPCTSPWSIRT